MAKVNLELDKNFKGVLVIECPECHKSFKKPFTQARPAQSFKCPSGHSIPFTGDDLSRTQRAFDKLNATAKRLTKKPIILGK